MESGFREDYNNFIYKKTVCEGFNFALTGDFIKWPNAIISLGLECCFYIDSVQASCGTPDINTFLSNIDNALTIEQA